MAMALSNLCTDRRMTEGPILITPFKTKFKRRRNDASHRLRFNKNIKKHEPKKKLIVEKNYVNPNFRTSR